MHTSNKTFGTKQQSHSCSYSILKTVHDLPTRRHWIIFMNFDYSYTYSQVLYLKEPMEVCIFVQILSTRLVIFWTLRSYNQFVILQERKSCNKSVKRHCYFSTQKYDDSITRYFPLSKKEFQNNLHGKFSGSYLDYTIFICKFATEEKWFWQLEPFSKLKTAFCEYWSSIKINMT